MSKVNIVSVVKLALKQWMGPKRILCLIIGKKLNFGIGVDVDIRIDHPILSH